MVTAKLFNATSGALSAKFGIMIRESMDNGAYVQLGRIPTGSFSGYIWRTVAAGGTGGVPSFTGKIRWMRLIRQGNRLTAFHAPDSGGNPGTWVQLGQPNTIVMSTPVVVGFAVDNAGGTAGVLNVAQFTDLSIVPLNKAPVVAMAATATAEDLSVQGTQIALVAVQTQNAIQAAATGTHQAASANAEMMQQLAMMYGKGQIKPVVDQTLPMSELPKAFEIMGSRSVKGKLVLVN